MLTNKKNKFFSLFIIALVLIVTIWFITRDKRDPDLIAKVGFREIRVKQFKDEIKRRSGNYSRALNKQKLLDEMIAMETILSKVFETGLDKDPEIVKLYNNLLIGKYKQRNLKPLVDNVEITEEDVKAYYEKNIDKYTKPEKVRLAIIFMKTHPTMSEEKLEKIKNRIIEAKKLANKPVKERGFGKISIQYSEDQTTRYKGGDIGWIYKNRKYRWENPVIEAGFALERIGSVSNIISTKKGLYIAKLLDRRKSEISTLKKVKGRIRHKMLLDRRRKAEANFHKNLKEITKIEIFHDVFDAVASDLKEVKDKKQPPSLP